MIIIIIIRGPASQETMSLLEGCDDIFGSLVLQARGSMFLEFKVSFFPISTLDRSLIDF